MKKATLLLLSLCITAFSLQSQITLVATDMPGIGETEVDITAIADPGISVGNSGANQTWDFSGLETDYVSTGYFIDPAGTPGENDFPTATMAIDYDGDFSYLEVNINAVYLLGASSDTSGMGDYFSIPLNPTEKVFQFPSTYGTSYTDQSGFSFTSDGSSIGVDSIRVTNTTNKSVNFDGYGTVITPLGSYNCLREQVIRNSSTLAEVLIFGFWQPLFDESSIDTSYNWYSKESKGALVTIDIFDGLVTDVSYKDLAPSGVAPVASFSYASQDLSVDFTDLSSNQPTSWDWDFGDGNTSTTQNPSHTYAGNGTYTVCLTATNNAGSDTDCQAVTVMVTSTKELLADLKVEVSPNPAIDWINLKLESSDNQQLDFVLFNALGQPVKNQTIQSNGHYNIDIKNVSAGMYYFVLRSENGNFITNGSLIISN